MKLKKILLLGLALLISNQVTWADEVEFSKQYDNCMENSGGITIEMLDCIGAETRRQDIKLNSKHPANTALPSDPISLNLVPT